MSEHLKRCGRFFLIILACLFIVGCISAFFDFAGFLLTLIGIPLLLLAIAVGGAIGTVRGITLARQSSSKRACVSLAFAVPAMIVATLLLALPAIGAGGFYGTWTRLMINRDHYETIIATAQKSRDSSNGTSALQEDNGVEYIVDQGPPVRVAFNPEGMLDNWRGIIFDPTGAVMRADGFDSRTGKFVAPDKITGLFGGDLVSCRKLWGDYYYCSFT